MTKTEKKSFHQSLAEWKLFIYNPTSGEFLGRTSKSWGERAAGRAARRTAPFIAGGPAARLRGWAAALPALAGHTCCRFPPRAAPEAGPAGRAGPPLWGARPGGAGRADWGSRTCPSPAWGEEISTARYLVTRRRCHPDARDSAGERRACVGCRNV